MPDHVATVTAHFERDRDDAAFKAPTTYAIIEVRPPIEPAELFRKAVLGKEWCLVDVETLFKNGKATVFLAQSSLLEIEDRHKDIETVAKRIGELANNPEATVRMMEETPFPEPKIPEPVTEVESPVDELRVDLPPVEQLNAPSVGGPPVDMPPIKLPEEPPRIGSPTIKVARIDTPRLPDRNLPWPPRVNENDKN